MLVIPIFVPHAGCPHNCCFCNQKTISGSKSQPNKDDIINTIETFRKAAARFDEVQIAFFGGSFTAIDPEIQETYLITAQPYLKINGGFVDTIRLSTRPDAIDTDVIARLKKYHATIVELGTQSMIDKVLRISERGHSAMATENASKLLKDNGFVLGLQMMTGLPGATTDDDIETADRICALKPDFVRIYPTIVVKNTKLERDYLNGEYTPMPLETAVELCAKLWKKFESHNIKVVRMGLQSTDTITNDGEMSEVVAGPYHEAFGELVKSRIMLEKITAMLDKLSDRPELFGYSLRIITPRELTSSATGYGGRNIRFLKEKYGFRYVKVIPAKDAQNGIFPNFYDNEKTKIFSKITDRSPERPDGREVFVIETEINRL